MVRDLRVLRLIMTPMGLLVPFLIMGRVTYIHHYVRGRLIPLQSHTPDDSCSYQLSTSLS